MAIFYGCAGILILLIYRQILRSLAGRRVHRYVTVTDLSEHGISPAACRYVYLSGQVWADFRLLYAALISMAVKGVLCVEDNGKVFVLKKIVSGDESLLSDEEKELLCRLFHGGNTLSLRAQTLYNLFRAAIVDIYQTLYGRYRSSVPSHSPLPYLSIPVALIATFLMFGRDVTADPAIALMLVFPFLCIIGVVWSVRWLIRVMQEKQRYKSSLFSRGDVLIWFMVSIIVLAGIASAFIFSGALPPVYWLYLGITGIIFGVMASCLRIPIQIEGDSPVYSLVLSYAASLSSEAMRQKVDMLSPTEAADNFLEHLPYAIALGEEKEWALLHQGRMENMNAMPGWFVSKRFEVENTVDFVYVLTLHLFPAISSAAHPYQLPP